MSFELKIYDHSSTEQIKDVLFRDQTLSGRLLSDETIEAAGKHGLDAIMHLVKTQIDDILIGDTLAERFLRTIEEKKGKAVLGFFTGSTPITGYKRTVELARQKGVSWKDVITFNMDEYDGLPEDHPQRYDSFMWENLFRDVEIPSENVHFPGSDNYNRYDQMIKELGGIDHQGGGIGSNGHIAFNEPGSSPYTRTRRVYLVFSTIRDNSRFFNYDMGKVPKTAFSMGLATLMETKKLDIYITGAHKAKATAKAICGPVTTDVPASLVQDHLRGCFMIDGASAYLIEIDKISANPKNKGVYVYKDATDTQVRSALERVANMKIESLKKDIERINPVVESMYAGV